ncbi:hypothetical protein TSUD_359760 [Trifolium subterraneum]|uniref:Uncharacterized protein n=1 Tax=Trifolium subterraneum TaxID=3900 RepID=A0A2Z6MM45_TRISU|nr:hypothetical protein TSUD_359760 [Trifolium subterraneum]
MVDDNCMNELEATIQSISATLKKFLQTEELRHIEYLRSGSTDVSRVDQIEAKLYPKKIEAKTVALQVSSASNGGSYSSKKSSMNQPFQLLTRAIDKSHEEIDTSEFLDDKASESYTATPYAADDFSSSEALSKSFSTVHATSLSSASAIAPIVEYDATTMPKCLLIPSDVEHDSYSKKEMQLDFEVFNPGVVPTQSQIHLSDPPDLVPVPPPPLAPPWLHHSIYLELLELSSLFPICTGDGTWNQMSQHFKI